VKSRKRLMHKAVVTMVPWSHQREMDLERARETRTKHPFGDWGRTGNVEMHGHMNVKNCRMPKCRNECKIPWNQSNGAGEHEHDRRANIARHSETARNH
jgi:hypothetical protein